MKSFRNYLLKPLFNKDNEKSNISFAKIKNLLIKEFSFLFKSFQIVENKGIITIIGEKKDFFEKEILKSEIVEDYIIQPFQNSFSIKFPEIKENIQINIKTFLESDISLDFKSKEYLLIKNLAESLNYELKENHFSYKNKNSYGKYEKIYITSSLKEVIKILDLNILFLIENYNSPLNNINEKNKNIDNFMIQWLSKSKRFNKKAFFKNIKNEKYSFNISFLKKLSKINQIFENDSKLYNFEFENKVLGNEFKIYINRLNNDQCPTNISESNIREAIGYNVSERVFQKTKKYVNARLGYQNISLEEIIKYTKNWHCSL